MYKGILVSAYDYSTTNKDKRHIKLPKHNFKTSLDAVSEIKSLPPLVPLHNPRDAAFLLCAPGATPFSLGLHDTYSRSVSKRDKGKALKIACSVSDEFHNPNDYLLISCSPIKLGYRRKMIFFD